MHACRSTLEDPTTVGPEDIPINEFLQQLDSLTETPVAIFGASHALDQLIDASAALARSVTTASANGRPTNSAEIADIAGKIADHASNFEHAARGGSWSSNRPDARYGHRQDPGEKPEGGSNLDDRGSPGPTTIAGSLRDIIENSTYASFSDFLKEMVKIAQELREKATEVKQAAIAGKFDLMMKAAEEMKNAADLAHESRQKQIEADKTQAIGQLVSGAFGMLLVPAAGFDRTQSVASSLNQSASSGVGGYFGLQSGDLKAESDTFQHQSDLANVAKTKLEAAAQLMDSNVQIADDLRDIGKGVRDMALKLYQDFISAQNQAIQRANV